MICQFHIRTKYHVRVSFFNISDELMKINSLGQPLKLECKIEGAPLTDLVWYKDGELVVPDDRIRIESDSDGGRARLIINSCNANDEGKL